MSGSGASARCLSTIHCFSSCLKVVIQTSFVSFHKKILNIRILCRLPVGLRPSPFLMRVANGAL